MISSISTILTLFLLIFLPSDAMSLNKAHNWNTGRNSHEMAAKAEQYHIVSMDDKYERTKETKGLLIKNFDLDLDSNGKDESVMVTSYVDLSGNQDTKVYIDSSPKPVFTETGSFYAMKTHKIDNSPISISELQLQSGQSINTLFYIYRKGKLVRVPVSTERPPSWHGISSRNSPEFKDIDNDGTQELLAYYNFLSDATRKVEVYKFNGKIFNKIQEYEEANPDR